MVKYGIPIQYYETAKIRLTAYIGYGYNVSVTYCSYSRYSPPNRMWGFNVENGSVATTSNEDFIIHIGMSRFLMQLIW